MLNENTIIHGNIREIRRLLKEYASRGDIAEAIDNRDILFIYYAGDDTIRRGYRTIEPHVLGFIKKEDGQGELALRAWQQAGASDTFKNPVGRWAKNPPRNNHEKFQAKGKFGQTEQPGWRLFKLRGITNVLHTGKKFPAEGESFRPLYNPNDKQLDVIVSYKPSSDVGSQKVSGSDSIEIPDVTQQKLSAFDTQTKNWKIDASDQEATLGANVAGLWEKIRKFSKQAPKNYDVGKKDGKYFAVKTNSRDRRNYSDDEIVGNLSDLHNKYSSPDWDERFFTNRKRDAEIADRKTKDIQNV
jgi:hypothetical protein